MTTAQAVARRPVGKIRLFVDNQAYCARERVQIDIALLGLLSKSIRFSEAACHLVAGGFHEEAMALARFGSRSISNNEIRYKQAFRAAGAQLSPLLCCARSECAGGGCQVYSWP